MRYFSWEIIFLYKTRYRLINCIHQRKILMDKNASYFGLPWPNDFLEDREYISEKWKISQINLHKELAGKSGAFVFLAHVEGKFFDGFAILKIERREPRFSLPSEADQLQTAIRNSGDFSKKHLPEVLLDYKRDTVNATLFSIAASGLEYVFALAKLNIGGDTTIGYVSSGLSEWNGIGHTKANSAMSAPALLQKWLGYRLVAESGGRLPKFFEDCGVDANSEGFSAGGTVYPNPLNFCLNVEAAEDIYPIYGQQHGDCHGNNILLTQPHGNGLPEYYLIDFALYEPHWPIFYDHAYLEFSLLLEYARDFEDKRWNSFLTYCGKRPSSADKGLLRPEDDGYVSIVREIRNGTNNWIAGKYSSIQASVESQQVLSRVAVGLNFVNKAGLGMSERRKAAIYAAHELKEYYRLKKLTLPESGNAFVDPEESAVGSDMHETSDWRKVWESCEKFNNEYVHILVIGKDLKVPVDDLKAIGSLPWSLVVDFNPSSTLDGVLSAAKEELQRRRGYHRLTPDQQQVDINFNQGTLWLMAAGTTERPDTLSLDFKDWRYGKIRDIGNHFDLLRRKTTPKPVRALFLYNDVTEKIYFNIIGDRLLEIFHENQLKITVCRSPHLIPLDGEDLYQDIASEPSHWLAAMAKHVGPTAGDQLIYLPKRIQDVESPEIERVLHGFLPTDLLNVEEDLELVHPSLETEVATDSIGDFLRGNTISWAELGRGFDVKLDMYSALKKDVIHKLEAYGNETVELAHEPGAGGTTVARRLAWDLHRDFPCAVLRQKSDATASRIALLYRETNLPVFIVIEAGVLSVPEREYLFKAIREEKARVVFLYVTRFYNSSIAKHRVRPPLSSLESSLFLKKYAQPDELRMENMRNLATKNEMAAYRLPFFFGLYAFEENFTHVDIYVAAHLQDLSEFSRTLIRYLALVSKFSQSAIKKSILAAIAGHDDTSFYSSEELLGSNAARLVISDVSADETTIRVVHPLIAEEILRQTVSEGGSTEDWKQQLGTLSADFINSLADACGDDSDSAVQLLNHMFIQREHWSDSGSKTNFSPLIMAMPSVYSQANVLEVLTNRFPGEAHFWNHRGRHSNIRLREEFTKAEGFLKKSIELEPNHPMHHHSLGMVYRFEVERLLTGILKARKEIATTLEDVKYEIDNLYILADACFENVRKFDEDNEHGYVSNIQLTFFVVDQMRKISGENDYAKFFTTSAPVVGWLRGKLEKAKELLDQIALIQGRETSSYVARYSEQYRGLMGDYDAMISGLSKLLKNDGENKSSLRRLISDCIRTQYKDNWTQVPEENLEKIREFALENIQSASATHRDFLNWLNASRRLPNFDFNRAISVMDRWAANGDPHDAHYYLFVLHVTKWIRGLSTNLTAAFRHLAVTNVNNSDTWSNEWAAISPEGNTCGFIPHSELGNWSIGADGHKFFENSAPLLRVVGVVTEIKNARSGSITIYGAEQSAHGKSAKISAFFVPGTDFIVGRDEGALVTAFIGFSYSGLRAWKVKLQ
jgi:hypothetical protein